MTLKHSFDPEKTSFNDHYWALRDLKISSLMTVDSGVSFNGARLTEDEEITPSLENQVVVDWLESIGGIKLVKFIGHEYSKELETISLFDLQESMGQQENMKAILEKMELDDEARANRAEIKAIRNTVSKRNDNRNTFPSRRNNRKPNRPFQDRTCYFCKEIGNEHYKTHDSKFCRLREKNKEGQNSAGKSKTFKVEVDQNSSSSAASEDEQTSDDETKFAEVLSRMKTGED